jgi:lipopolysaccharide export system protein LptA
LAIARQVFTYRDKSGSLTVRARSGLVEQQANNRVHLELRGSPVVLTSSTDGLTLNAPAIVCDAITKGKTTIEKAVGTGGLTALKSAASGNTTITSSSGSYTAGAQPKLILSGSVKIVDRTTTRTTTITGRNGTALLEPGSKGPGSGLRRATLSGPVRVEAVQQNTTGGRIIATGSRLEVDNVAHVVTLTGNVNVTGNQASTLGELHGADKAVLVLNSKGEVSSVRVSQGASQ